MSGCHNLAFFIFLIVLKCHKFTNGTLFENKKPEININLILYKKINICHN